MNKRKLNPSGVIKEACSLITAPDARRLIRHANAPEVRELIDYGAAYKIKNWQYCGLTNDDIKALKDFQKGLGDSIRGYQNDVLILYAGDKKQTKNKIINNIFKNKKPTSNQKIAVSRLLDRLDIYVHLVHVGLAVKNAGLTLFCGEDGAPREAYAFPLSMDLATRKSIVLSPINNDVFIRKIRGLNIDRSAVDARKSENEKNKVILQNKFKEIRFKMPDNTVNEVLIIMVEEINAGRLPWAQTNKQIISSPESLKKIIFPLPK